VVRRGFDLGKCGPSAADLGDDLLGLFVPDEGLGLVVPMLGPDLNGFDQVRDRREDTTTEAALGQFVEPALDEVPTRTTRSA
jgi:hypothetical protein